MLPGIMTSGFGAGYQTLGTTNPTLISAITTGSQTSSLQLCLDAGDSSSYSSGQKWLDRSGNGYDFILGTTTGAESSDPTFNGTPGGVSSNEYWSFSGGNVFIYDQSNEPWMTNIHKDSANFSMIAAVTTPNLTTTKILFGTDNTSGTGFAYRFLSTETGNFYVSNAGATVLSKTGSTALSTDTWHIIGLSINESGATGFHYLDGVYNQISGVDTFNATYTSPSASGTTTGVFTIGGGTDLATGLLPSGSKIGFLACWSRALSKANFDTLYASLKGRYGLT